MVSRRIASVENYYYNVNRRWQRQKGAASLNAVTRIIVDESANPEFPTFNWTAIWRGTRSIGVSSSVYQSERDAGIGVSRFTGKLGSRRAAWHGACESPQKNKKRAEGRRSLAAGQPFYFYTRSPVSFLAVFYPRSPFSPAFARNKFINKRAGDPRPLQGAPAEIERVENNRARRDANQPRETIFRSSPPVPSAPFLASFTDLSTIDVIVTCTRQSLTSQTAPFFFFFFFLSIKHTKLAREGTIYFGDFLFLW